MKFFSFFLVFLVACAVVPPQPKDGDTKPSGNQFLENPSFCNVDADCTCGGIDRNTDNCFIGNKLYASKNVDFTRDCPDFCTGIAGHLETKCVDNACKSVQRELPVEPEVPAEEPVYCTMDAKECPDGTYVSRVAPNCEFAPCPAISSLSDAHWLCEDGTWKQTPEDCFENYCLQKSDCQLMGVTSPCGPYLIAGPTKTLHKPPVFYADRCGAEKCTVPIEDCSKIIPLNKINGFDCIDTKCVARIRESY